MVPFARGHALCAGNDQLGPGIFEVCVSSRTEVPGTVAHRLRDGVAPRREFCDDARRSDMCLPHVSGLGIGKGCTLSQSRYINPESF